MSILPKAIYRLNAITIKLPILFCKELAQIISQFCMEAHKTLNNHNNLKKEEWSWRNQPSWLQTILQSNSHQDSMVLAQSHKYRSIEWNRKSRDKSTLPEYHIFEKGGKNMQWIKDSLFNKWCWENWTNTYKRIKLEHFLTPYREKNSKWIKDLNVRPETIKL